MSRSVTIARPRRRADPAFSLIEILIAVIILALGLLGLGAVFPVVIREQKIAEDRINGTLAINNIRATLLGLARLNQKRQVIFETDTATIRTVYSGWSVLQEDWKFHEVVNNLLANPDTAYNEPDFATPTRFDFSADGLWETNWLNIEAAPGAPGAYFGSGDIEFVSQDRTLSGQRIEYPQAEFDAMRSLLDSMGNPSPITFKREFREFRIPLSARLNPAGDPSDGSPTMVWDFVVRRKLETRDPRALQVAVFVRRVDPRLRAVPRTPPLPGNDTVSIREQFLSPAVADRRLPLGEDAQGLPTFDGTDGNNGVFYSGVHQVGAFFFSDASDPFSRKRDRIAIAGFGADASLLGQPGQRVVDNLGNIYTVVGFDGAFVKVDPPVPPSVLDTAANDPSLTSIRQLIFTTQPPVAVFVLEIEP